MLLSDHEKFPMTPSKKTHLPYITALPSLPLGAGHSSIDIVLKNDDDTIPILELSPVLSAGFSTPAESPNVIDLVSPSPSSLYESAFHDSIIHCKNDDEIIDLSSPSPNPATKPLVLPTTKRSGTDSVEILSPVLTSKPNKALCRPQNTAAFVVQKRSRSESIEVISPPRDIKHAKIKQRNPTEDITLARIQVHDFFRTLNEVRDAIFAQEEPLGHKWIKNQTKLRRDGTAGHVTFRCNRQSHHLPKHNMSLDPSDHRRGRSVRVGCQAHVNVCQNAGGWHVTVADFEHNHGRLVPAGGRVTRPPTKEQQAIISDYAKIPKIKQSQVAAIVKNHPEFIQKPLEPRQITNILNTARSAAQDKIAAAGGDFNSILTSLEERARTEGWKYDVLLNDSNTVTAIWWQSGTQNELGKRFHDILLNDNTYNRNNCGYVLNTGIIVDSSGKSRNAFYALHAREDVATHSWVLRCYIKHTGIAPEIFGSDRDGALIRSVAEIAPLSYHFYCLHHTQSNVVKHARQHLGGHLGSFLQDFWAAYCAVSPEGFERLWRRLISNYPPLEDYLHGELYSCREQWAWAWVSTKFTAGIRTTGRVESENRVSKAFAGAKTSAKQLFDLLNERTMQQTSDHLERVRDVSLSTSCT